MHNIEIFYKNEEPTHLQKYVDLVRVDSFEEISQEEYLFSDQGVLSFRRDKQNHSIDYDEIALKLHFQKIGVNDLLAKAINAKNSKNLRFIDCTCGLGGDSIYASRFFTQVHSYERVKEVYLLNLDALHRSGIEKLKLFNKPVDPSGIKESDVVYFDPMYQEMRKSKSLAKKNMQLLKSLCGLDADQNDFFLDLLSSSAKRIVYKRPLRAEIIEKKYLTTQFKGKNIRYDVYCK